MRSRALAIVGIAVIFAAVMGCSNRRGESGANGGADSPNTLRVVRNIGGREGFRVHFEAWKAAFERDNPGWVMELIDLGNSDASEYYKTRVATGDMPEVIQTWNMTDFLAGNDIIVPLPDDYYERHGIRPPPALDGKYYTSQGGLQLLGVAVNRDLWEQAGIDEPPATWRGFMENLETIQQAGITPLVYGGLEWSASMPMSEMIQTYMYEHDLNPDRPSWTALRDEGKVSFATDPRAAEIMQWMAYLTASFASEGVLSDGYNEEQADFYSGEAATWIMGCWIGGDLEAHEVDFRADYWPIPALDESADPTFITNSGGQSGWAISTAASEGEKYDKAVAVLDAFYDPDVYQLFLNGEAMLDDRIDSPVSGPKCDSEGAQYFYDSMAANYAEYGGAIGSWRSCTDKWPAGFDGSLMRAAQELIIGEADHASLLQTLDDDWDNARKGE